MNGRRKPLSKKNIEKALNDYVRAETEGATFPTGWVMVVSLAPPTGDNTLSDSYLNITSDGLPAHAQMGLLEIAKSDMHNISMLGTISRSILGTIFGGNEENDEDDS